MTARSVLRPMNPATLEPLPEVACATVEEIHEAVARARATLPAWGATTPHARATLLARAGEAVDAHAEELAALVTMEMGKPRAAAVAEARMVAQRLREAHAHVRFLEPQEYRSGTTVTAVLRNPLGVVAAIAPWNFPLSLPEMILSPALLAGNTVVFKASERVPHTEALLHRLIASVLPFGTLELVQGGPETGRTLVTTDVRMVAFIGSRRAGQAVMREAARGLKRLVLELGGKDPMLVLEDADVLAASAFAVEGAFRNAGQVCVSVERAYVREEVADQFLQHVVDRTRRLSIGAGDAPDADLGPLASEDDLARVIAQLDEARAGGAQVLIGGGRLPGRGFFLTPAVVVDAPDDSKLMREETFGPVLAVRRVRDDEEAVRLANDGPFGLGATVWSRDAVRARSLAERLHAGMVGINRPVDGVPGTPWVGAKESGFGFLRSGEALRQFTQTRTISFERS